MDGTGDLTYVPVVPVVGVETIRLELIERPITPTPQDYLEVVDLHVYDQNNNVITTQGTAHASSQLSIYSPSRARDLNSATFFSSANEADAWLELRFPPLGVTVSRVSIVQRSSTAYRLFPSRLSVTTGDNGRLPWPAAMFLSLGAQSWALAVVWAPSKTVKSVGTPRLPHLRATTTAARVTLGCTMRTRALATRTRAAPVIDSGGPSGATNLLVQCWAKGARGAQQTPVGGAGTPIPLPATATTLAPVTKALQTPTLAKETWT